MSDGLAVLGATGSIGRQTLEVAGQIGIPVVAVGARRPSEQLAEIARAHPDAVVAASGGSNDERRRLIDRLPGRRVEFGSDALANLAGMKDQIVMNAVVGLAGLPITLAGLEAGNRVALANKESMVAGGPLVKRALRAGGGELIPVDSEHSAIFQCMVGEALDSVDRIILTASGGPFRGWTVEQQEDVKPEQALRHPNWSMGPRITIDSATLINKALEVIEAHQIFELGLDHIDVVIHPQSIIHSLVAFTDGSIKAQLGQPDMRIPIGYALGFPHRQSSAFELLPWSGLALTFDVPDQGAFPGLALGYAAGRKGGSAPAVFNAADEVAVEAFLQKRLGFTSIVRVIAETLDTVEIEPELTDLESLMDCDKEARSTTAAMIAGAC
ncbi:MAG: 1-deoxy-D-xylulose-5-phosphate reductoisomerase [Actinomycetota bacterium]